MRADLTISEMRAIILQDEELINKRKYTQRQFLEVALKKYWLSNYMIQQLVKSSSGDREMRRIRENPPENFIVVQRKKEQPKQYNNCLEFKLVRVEDYVA